MTYTPPTRLWIHAEELEDQKPPILSVVLYTEQPSTEAYQYAFVAQPDQPAKEEVIARLAELPLIVRGSPDEVFQAIRGLQETARQSVSTSSSSPSVREAAEAWIDEGGHAWEIRQNVTCVECPHCCFMFAAIHGDGNNNGYSCPNCEGCSSVSAAGGDEDGESIAVAELQRELAFYFGQHHGALGHRLDALRCMENNCVRVRNLCLTLKTTDN